MNDGPIGHTSLLDSVIYGLLGPPQNMLTPEQNAEASAKRKNAGNMAKEVASNPDSAAAAYMGPQSGGGESLAHTIGTIGKILTGFGI